MIALWQLLICIVLFRLGAAVPFAIHDDAKHVPQSDSDAHYNYTFVPSITSDGRRKISVISADGTYNGFLIEDPNSKSYLSAFDMNGHPVSFEENETDDAKVNDTDKRGLIPIIIKLAAKFAKIIARWGRRVWDFIYCIGVSDIWECSDEFVNCAGLGDPPWKCLDGLSCLVSKGKAVKHCI